MNVIDQRIHQVLDGELAAEAVPAELRRAVAQLAAAADLLAAPPAGAVTSLESRVMAELRRPAPSHEGIAQFVGRFPEAQSVHAVGTFNDWRAGSIALEDQDHDGVWRATVLLPTGTYEYMFVVDGERWVPDHLAERLVADDFGRENSIVIVRPDRR